MWHRTWGINVVIVLGATAPPHLQQRCMEDRTLMAAVRFKIIDSAQIKVLLLYETHKALCLAPVRT